EALQPADPEIVAAEAVTDADGGELVPFVERGARVHARRERVLREQQLEHLQLFGRRVVVNRRDAELGEVCERGTRFTDALLERARRDHAADTGGSFRSETACR